MVRFFIFLVLYSLHLVPSFAQVRDANGDYVVDEIIKTYYKTDNGLPFKVITVDYNYDSNYKCININKTTQYNDYYTHSRDNVYDNTIEETWIKSYNKLDYQRKVNNTIDNTQKIIYTIYGGRITGKSVQNYRDGQPYVAYNREYSYKNIKNEVKLSKITYYWTAWNNRLKNWRRLDNEINRNIHYDNENNAYISEPYEDSDSKIPFSLRIYYWSIPNTTNIGLFVLTNTYEGRPDITINEIELSCDWIGLKSGNVVDSFEWIEFISAFHTKYEIIDDKIMKVKIYDRQNNLFSTIDINYLF